MKRDIATDDRIGALAHLIAAQTGTFQLAVMAARGIVATAHLTIGRMAPTGRISVAEWNRAGMAGYTVHLVQSGWMEFDGECLIMRDWPAHAPNHVRATLKRTGQTFYEVGDDSSEVVRPSNEPESAVTGLERSEEVGTFPRTMSCVSVPVRPQRVPGPIERFAQAAACAGVEVPRVLRSIERLTTPQGASEPAPAPSPSPFPSPITPSLSPSPSPPQDARAATTSSANIASLDPVAFAAEWATPTPEFEWRANPAGTAYMAVRDPRWTEIASNIPIAMIRGRGQCAAEAVAAAERIAAEMFGTTTTNAWPEVLRAWVAGSVPDGGLASLGGCRRYAVSFLVDRINAYHRSEEGGGQFHRTLPRWLSEHGYYEEDSAWNTRQRTRQPHRREGSGL